MRVCVCNRLLSTLYTHTHILSLSLSIGSALCLSLSLSASASDLTECMCCYCRQVCHENLRPHLPADAPADLVQLITAMWDESPRKRPSLADILSVVAPSVNTHS
jgi:hypothetical protein